MQNWETILNLLYPPLFLTAGQSFSTWWLVEVALDSADSRLKFFVVGVR
jgi:hypothetical protein